MMGWRRPLAFWERKRLERWLAKDRANVERLEAWLDPDRTFTPVEISKISPGWYDNNPERREAA